MIIGKLLANRLAEVIDSVVILEQSTFIKGRQILDGFFLLNEVLVFKVDFEKSYDSISWDYLIEIMQYMGFDPKQFGWILEMLSSARASVLVNGSPTQ